MYKKAMTPSHREVLGQAELVKHGWLARHAKGSAVEQKAGLETNEEACWPRRGELCVCDWRSRQAGDHNTATSSCVDLVLDGRVHGISATQGGRS